jgi:hypothetical protein
VATPGRLYVASYFPGEWSTRQGDLATPDEAYAGVTGDLDMLILRWQGDPIDGLERLAALGDVDDLLALEIDRLLNPVLPPKAGTISGSSALPRPTGPAAPTGTIKPSAAIQTTTQRC